MTITLDDSALGGGVTTTDATVTDVPGTTVAVPDKSCVTYELEAWAVRNNTTNPIAYYTKRIYTVALSGGASSIVGSSILAANGDGAMAAALVAVGTSANVKAQATGLASTTLDWRIKITVKTLTSN